MLEKQHVQWHNWGTTSSVFLEHNMWKIEMDMVVLNHGCSDTPPIKCTLNLSGLVTALSSRVLYVDVILTSKARL